MILVGYFKKQIASFRSQKDLPPCFFWGRPSDPWKEERADSDPTGALTPKERPIRTEDVKTCNSTSVSVDKTTKHEQTTQNTSKTYMFFGDVTREKFHQKKNVRNI